MHVALTVDIILLPIPHCAEGNYLELSIASKNLTSVSGKDDVMSSDLGNQSDASRSIRTSN